MLFGEIIAVYSENHTIPIINIFCGQNAELLNVEVIVYIVTTEFQRVNNTPLSQKLDIRLTENEVLRRIFGPKMKLQDRQHYIMRSFICVASAFVDELRRML
jgi:acetone carboxylase gamma subunit